MISIIPYDAAYDEEISQLEDAVSQGNQVTLKIIKDHFLDRAAVFEKRFPILSIDVDKKLVGTCVGVNTTIEVNGQQFQSGFALDAKVKPRYRNKGAGRLMAKYVYENFFKAEGFKKNFTTLKLKNIPVIKLVSKAINNIWLYDFVYLTIPTQVKINKSFLPRNNQKFSVRLFQQEYLPPEYYYNFSGGLGCFYTCKAYRLQITRISWAYKKGMDILQIVNPGRYSYLPKEKEIFNFACLYNHTEKNIHDINAVLEHLMQKKINYLLVCCHRKDSLYNYLKNFSINTYQYYVLADFPLSGKDQLSIDVRCL